MCVLGVMTITSHRQFLNSQAHSSWRDAHGEAVPPTKAQREGAEEASRAQPEGAGPEQGAGRSVRACGVSCRVVPDGCVFRVLAMGQIEWAMWANEQALASGLSE